MKQQVIWTTEAENDLAELWLASEDREAVVKASQRMDEILKQAGIEAGESRSGSLRILHQLPLGCYFRLRSADQTLLVLRVFRCRAT